MKYNKNGLFALAVASCSLLAFQAEAFDFTVSGFIRQEMAYKISNNENGRNRGGSKFNGRSTTFTGALAPLIAGLGAPATYTKPDKSKDNDWNVFATRLELDFGASFSENVTGFMKIRGFYQPNVYSNTRDSDWVDGVGGEPDQFRTDNHGNEATYLSMSNNDYVLDIPSMYLDYQNGPFWVRVGQQQIAWGEALFFRVADQASGLDFRRHVIFDLGSEEYADERTSAPAIRASMTFADNWEIEAFLQMFQPSVVTNNYSHYNLIANGFNPAWDRGFDKVDDQLNFGMRLQGNGLGEQGNWGVQFFAITRHDPFPIMDTLVGGDTRVTDALIEQGNFGIAALLNIGDGWESQPFIFEPDGDGAGSVAEWFYFAADMGADGVAVFNNVINESSYLTELVGTFLGLEPNANGEYFTSINGGGPDETMLGGLITVPGGVNATDVLELFFALGQISGHESLVGALDVNYASENLFGFGTNYIFYADPEDWWDQLVVRYEMSYTPGKKFTNNLSKDFLEEDQFVHYVGMEKYHRFSQNFPATFLIFQYMFRSHSDLIHRHLSTLGGDSDSRPGGGEDGRGWHGLVLAASQPFPNLTWRADFAFLYDFENGFLLQTGGRYKPNADWTVEAFVNIIDGEKDTIFQAFDWANDLTVRVTYQF